MSKHTLNFEKKQIRIINVVKAVMDIKSINSALAFIIDDYANTTSYSKFITEKRKNIKNGGELHEKGEKARV